MSAWHGPYTQAPPQLPGRVCAEHRSPAPVLPRSPHSDLNSHPTRGCLLTRNSDRRGHTLSHAHLALRPVPLRPVPAASLRKSVFQRELANTHRPSVSSNKETKVQTEVLQPVRGVHTQGHVYIRTNTCKSPTHAHRHADTRHEWEAGPPGALTTLCSPQGSQLRTPATRHVWAWNKHVFNSLVPSFLFLLKQVNPTPQSPRERLE